MNLGKSIETLWYENANGDKWYPRLDGGEHPEEGLPDGFVYQHSQFPTHLRHSILKLVQPSEVEECLHPIDSVFDTDGWVDGIIGRECKECNGTQVAEEAEGWPLDWSAYGSRSIVTMDSGWSEELALALCTAKTTPSAWDFPAQMTLSQAILISASACERCINAMAHGVGLSWGYPEFSEDWQKTKTYCDLCHGVRDR